jgi:hypothetical protein
MLCILFGFSKKIECIANTFIKVVILQDMKELFIKYKKPIIIIVSITILQIIFGFDPKFCLINIIWLFV